MFPGDLAHDKSSTPQQVGSNQGLLPTFSRGVGRPVQAVASQGTAPAAVVGKRGLGRTEQPRSAATADDDDRALCELCRPASETSEELVATAEPLYAENHQIALVGTAGYFLLGLIAGHDLDLGLLTDFAFGEVGE